ncbi:MAG: thiamine pyrophosphate-requiring protein [Acidobacteria bacterium]|nr:MAG: thiamine pyrophosphate-requiring protein [Acidobacteriota bacterium]
MAETTSDFLVKRLGEWGVRRVYGYPGDGISGIMGALQRAEGKIDFIQVRHEEMAAFMACAHAKFTGEPGVCLATSGPGAIHLLNGLYDAKLDHQPVVAIVGQSSRLAMGGSYQQEVDLQNLFKDVASEFVQTAMVPGQIKHLIDRAFRIALAERTVTCIIIPHDLQDEEMAQPPRVVPHQDDLRRAADVLNSGKRVAMLVGQGAMHASDEIIEVAELLGAGVAKALLGKAALPDELPFVTGSIGLLGTKPSWVLMDECDTLLMVGSSFPYPEFLPEEGKARGVQIDIDGRMLSIRYPMEINLVGDSKETLRALVPMLKRKTDRSWREKIEKEIREWWKLMEERAMTSADPINPQRVFWELSPKLPANCIVTADSGSAASWYARDLKFRRGMMGSLSGNLATMGPGVPYVIAAKFAFPDRVAIACVGDGAFQMNGMNEMITVAKYWREWADLNMVTWEQRVMAGDPKFDASQVLPDFAYAEFAQSLGLLGVRVEKPDRIGAAWDAALKAERPSVLEFHTDPEVPPLPPHITADQAKKFMKSLLHDPARSHILKQSMKELLDSVKV